MRMQSSALSYLSPKAAVQNSPIQTGIDRDETILSDVPNLTSSLALET